MEGFLVSARKYRPLKWSDVIGQEHISNTLKNALSQGQVAHAFLFTGPRGVGKTTCARILARVLNCENPSPEWEPCNVCKTCQAFQENNSFNIIELDAASNNGVEDMRALVEQVRYQPQYGKFKIYIIDEVHMLTSSAFNAFLKTLEEPPPYAKFILATTEKHKIIPTILSRCQVYDFRRIQVKDIIHQLEKICAVESIEADPEALYLIAQKADGAMRDALSIFDRITSFSGKKLSYKDVADNLNVLDQDYFFKFYDAFLMEDEQTAFLLYDKILKLGFDSEVLLEGLGLHARNLLVCKSPEMAALFEGSEHSKSRYLSQAENYSKSFLMTCLESLNESEINMGRARNKRLHVEILLNKLCQFRNLITKGISTTTAPAPEKKTSELSKEQIQIPQSVQHNSDLTDKVQQTVQISSAPVGVSNEFPKTTPLVNQTTVVPAASTDKVSNPGPAAVSSIPRLADLKMIKEKIANDERIRQENKMEFSEESVRIFWEGCIQDQKSNSLLAYMRQAKVLIAGNQVNFLVGSILAQEALRSELNLEEKIKSFFRETGIRMSVEIDPEMAQKEDLVKPKVLYSAKEKWDLLYAVNPEIEELRNVLELKIDED